MNLIRNPKTLTDRIVNAVCSDIHARAGGDDFFDSIDDDVRDDDLIPGLVAVVKGVLDATFEKLPTQAEAHWRDMCQDDTGAIFGFTNREVRVLFAEIDRLRLAQVITTGDLIAADIERKNLAADLVLSAAGERSLREYLWLSHGHKGVYGDDGEMQCGECFPLSHLYDYKREPLEKLVEATRLARQTVNQKALAAALEQAKALSA